MKLLLQKVEQGSKTAVYTGRIRVGDLIGRYKIDYYDKTENPDGYQRNPDMKRCISFANFIRAQLKAGAPLVIPTSILASTRSDLLITPAKDGVSVMAELSHGEFLYIVDGQHRTEAFKYAVQELGLGELEDFELPIVLIEGMELKDEIQQFLSINTNMRKVKVDLANQLLINLGAKVPEGRKQAVFATEISNLLADGEFDSPWNDKLKPANAITKGKKKVYWNTVLSFHNSLKPILNAQAISGLGERKIAEQLGYFWTAISELMPEAFSSSYSRYLVTKNNGFVSLHRVFVTVYSYLRYEKEIRQPKASDYKNVLIKAEDTVFNSEYWLRGEDGAAAFGGGFGGYSKLAENIIEELKNAGVDF
jgi:DGQHR domain-containing protein